MSAWTLKVGATTRSIAGWGIDSEGFTLARKSFEADLLSFAMTSAEAYGEPAFEDDAEVELFDASGVRRFVGNITEDITDLDAKTEVQRYVAKNAWAKLETCPYAVTATVKTEDFTGNVLANTTRTILAARMGLTSITKVTNKNQMEDLLDFAIADGISLQHDVDFSGLTPFYEEARNITVAAAMRRMGSHTPDCVSWFDYTTTPPTIYIRRRPTETAIDLDLSEYLPATGLVSARNIKALRDLFVDSVEIITESSELDDATDRRFMRLGYQFAGTARPAGRNIRATFGLSAQGSTNEEATPEDLAAAYKSALGELFYQATLTFAHRELPGTYRPGKLINFTGTGVRAAWATAKAIAQLVTEHPFRGITVVECGAPPMLNTATFAELQQRLAAVHTTGPVASYPWGGSTDQGVAVNPFPWGTIEGHITGNGIYGPADVSGTITDPTGTGYRALVNLAGVWFVGLTYMRRTTKADLSVLDEAHNVSVFTNYAVDPDVIEIQWRVADVLVPHGYGGTVTWRAP